LHYAADVVEGGDVGFAVVWVGAREDVFVEAEDGAEGVEGYETGRSGIG
jgi:hypothetical protein